MKTRWANVPQRAATISSHVCARGAFSFSLAANYEGTLISFQVYPVTSLQSYLSEKEHLNGCPRPIPPRARYPEFVRYRTGLQLKIDCQLKAENRIADY